MTQKTQARLSGTMRCNAVQCREWNRTNTTDEPSNNATPLLYGTAVFAWYEHHYTTPLVFGSGPSVSP